MTKEEIQEILDSAMFEQRKGNWIASNQLANSVLSSIQKLSKASVEINEVTVSAKLLLASNLEEMGLYQEAKVTCIDAIEMIESASLNHLSANAYNLLGIISFNLSEYKIALESYRKGLFFYEEFGDKKGEAISYGNMGNVFLKLSDYEQALDCYTKSLTINEELKDKKAIAISIGNIGNVYYNLKNYEKTVEYYTKSLQQREELDDKKGISITIGNLGSIYSELGEYEKALQYLSKSKSLKEMLGDTKGLANTFANIGSLYYSLQNVDKALEESKKALEIQQSIGDRVGIASTLLNIAEIYLNGNFTKIEQKIAKDYLFEALEINIDIGNKFGEKSIYNALSQLLENEGHYEESLEYLKKSIVLDNQINSEEAQYKARMLDFRRKIEESERDRQVKIARFQEQERLLHDVLPASIANRILQGETTIAENNQNVCIFFSDIVGFTETSQSIAAGKLVSNLNTIFQEYDRLAKMYSIEKIKTIGDAYMAVAGIDKEIEHPQKNIALFALEILALSDKLLLGTNNINIRIGIHIGEVVSGVIGGYKFTYDIWGDAVNIASRMESHSEPGKIHISEAFATSIEQHPEFVIIPRGTINIKGKGAMNTFWLEKGKEV